MGVLENIVQDNGPSVSSCGYCRGTESSVSHGMWAHRLSVDAYNDLLDRGWRRAGCWLYKPDMKTTCCPQYTIRLDATRFEPNKAHAKVIRKMRQWVESYNASRPQPPAIQNGTELDKQTETQLDVNEANADSNGQEKSVLQHSGESHVRSSFAAIQDACMECLENSEAIKLLFGVSFRLQAVSSKQRKMLPASVGCTSAVCFAAAGAARKAANDGPCPNHIASKLAAALNAARTTNESRLSEAGVIKVEAVKGHLNFHLQSMIQNDGSRTEPATTKRHKSSTSSEPEFSRSISQDQPDPASTDDTLPMKFLGLPRGSGLAELSVEFVSVAFDEEEFALYKKYQIHQHGDNPEDVTRAVYKRFLVDTPLRHVPGGKDGTLPCGYGTFHARYRVNKQLIAVSVVDVLPRCLSSKYFFWDTDLGKLSLGKFSALFEAYWVKHMLSFSKNFKYYYLGYYIHNCKKMKYKADYEPSDLLCPLQHVWVPFEEAKVLLEKCNGGYCVLSEANPTSSKHDSISDEAELASIDGAGTTLWERSANAGGEFSCRDVLSVTVLKEGQLTQLWQEISGSEDELLTRAQAWANAVGRPSKEMVYVLPGLWMK